MTTNNNQNNSNTGLQCMQRLGRSWTICNAPATGYAADGNPACNIHRVTVRVLPAARLVTPKENFEQKLTKFISAGYELLNAWDSNIDGHPNQWNADEEYGQPSYQHPLTDGICPLFTLSLDEWLVALTEFYSEAGK